MALSKGVRIDSKKLARLTLFRCCHFLQNSQKSVKKKDKIENKIKMIFLRSYKTDIIWNLDDLTVVSFFFFQKSGMFSNLSN